MRNAGGLLKESPAPPGTFPEYDCDCPESARMRGSGLFSVFFCGVTWWLGVVSCDQRGACLLGRLAYPAFSLLSCPHPPYPLPGGKGEILGYFMQGASPLASPRLSQRRRWNRGRTARPAGGVPALSPAYPAFGFVSCPIPPTPFPGGKGENQGYFMQGASPLASPRAEPTVRRKTDRKVSLRAVPAAKERGDRGRGTSAFEMVLSPGAGRTSAAGVQPPPGTANAGRAGNPGGKPPKKSPIRQISHILSV